MKWCVLLLVCLSASANAFTLVSEQEFAEEVNLARNRPKMPSTSQFNAKSIDTALPRIVFDKPLQNGVVSAPLDVVVKFIPESGTGSSNGRRSITMRWSRPAQKFPQEAINCCWKSGITKIE